MASLLFAVAVVTMLLSVYIAWLSHKKLVVTMNQLDEMLDAAIADNFTESEYDESRLSRLGCKLKHFLASSSISKRKIDEERAGIKSLISDISHQTKTPVANIMLYSELLQEQSDLSETGKDLAGQIAGQTQRLSFLITSLIKASRLENGIVCLAPQQTDVVQTVRGALRACEEKAAGKGITVQCDVPDELGVFHDAKWTQEALFNILDNAVKYTGQGGTVTVSVIDYEMFCRIDISDNGIGITNEDHTKIFGRFYRGHNASAKEGAGIGLFLSRRIINSQGGYIKVRSTVGQGSVFSVFLPKTRIR